MGRASVNVANPPASATRNPNPVDFDPDPAGGSRASRHRGGRAPAAVAGPGSSPVPCGLRQEGQGKPLLGAPLRRVGPVGRKADPGQDQADHVRAPR